MLYKITYKMTEQQIEPSVDYTYSQNEHYQNVRRITHMGERILNEEMIEV